MTDDNKLLDTSHLTTLAGLSGATIIATNALVAVFDCPAKLTAFVVALTLCLTVAVLSGQRSGQHLLVAALNGMLICPAAMGANTVAGKAEKALAATAETLVTPATSRANLPNAIVAPAATKGTPLPPVLPPTARPNRILRDMAPRPKPTPVWPDESQYLIRARATPQPTPVRFIEVPDSATVEPRVFREW